ncbi:MAG: gliding motility-associated C-terminal domain-containing protein [Bacteroidia bacterium]
MGVNNYVIAQTYVSKQVFDYTGADQILTIPPCITQIKVKVWGAGGGGSQYAGYHGGAGAGGYVEGVLNVLQGNVYTIMVGEGGATDGTSDNFSYGFGGSYRPLAFGGFGGGLSGLFSGSTSILATDHSRALLVAGGGGGGEKGTPVTDCTSGGQGGDLVFAGGMPTMQGDSPIVGSYGAGGGGGYYGGIVSLRLSGNGVWYAGEGGTNYIHSSVSNPVSLNSVDYGNWNASPHFHYDPPNITDLDYTPWVSVTNPGIGTANNNAYYKSGHGRVVVEFYASPITCNNDVTICEGESATLSVTGGNNYLWSTGNTTASFSSNPSTTATYIATETTTGCMDSVQVVVKNKPTLITNSPTICIGDTALLTVAGANSYIWSTTEINSSINVSPTSPTTYSVVGTTNGCNDTAQIMVSVNPLPIVDAGINDSICNGESANLQVSPNGVGFSYSWTPSATLNSSSIYNPIATPLLNTTYTVSVSDNNGCLNIDSVTIFVDDVMNASINVSNVTCFGLCDGQTNVIITGGTMPYLYDWNTGCTASSCNNLCEGSYSVTVTDLFGCIIVSDTLITQPDTLIAAISSNTAVSCSDSCNGLATAIAIGGTSGSGYNYSWSTFPNQNTATASNLCPLTYTCTVTDANNCIATATVNISKPDSILIQINTTAVACNQNNGTAIANVSGGVGNYQYVWSNGSTDASISNLATGNYTVTVTDNNGCIAENVVLINSASNPIATLTATNYTVFKGTSVELSANGGENYEWIQPNDLACDSCQVITVFPDVTTSFCVLVTDSNACIDSTCVLITVEIPCPSEYQVPNAFSPNGDGYNDNFCLQGWNTCVSDFLITVFNRWGEKVYESNNPQFCWDGSSLALLAPKNNELGSAVFVYNIDAVDRNGNKINRKGNISLLR